MEIVEHVFCALQMSTVNKHKQTCKPMYLLAFNSRVWCLVSTKDYVKLVKICVYVNTDDNLINISACNQHLFHNPSGHSPYKKKKKKVTETEAKSKSLHVKTYFFCFVRNFFPNKGKALVKDLDPLYLVVKPYSLKKADGNLNIKEFRKCLFMCTIFGLVTVKNEDLVKITFEKKIMKTKFSQKHAIHDKTKTVRNVKKLTLILPHYEHINCIESYYQQCVKPIYNFFFITGEEVNEWVNGLSNNSNPNSDKNSIFIESLSFIDIYKRENFGEICADDSSSFDNRLAIARGSDPETIKALSNKEVNEKSLHFFLQLEYCGRDHWGLDCREWCPECQHGGQCHPNTGICICPPGYYGTFCQHGCDTGKFGSDCNFGCEESTLGFPAEQVCKGLTFCLPDPYGCSCAPGFTGSLCNQVCNGQNFGPNCGLSCDYCIGGCDTITGVCFDACVEGILCIDNLPLMLPYLAQAPKLSNISSNAAALSFHSWMELLDAGLQQTPILSYLVQMRKHDLDPWVQVASRPDGGKVILAELFPGQEYHVRVVISTVAGIEQGDTSHRRVQEAIFTTLCSEEVTTIPVVSNISQSSVILTWSSVEENQEFCDTQYKVNIVDG
ncbi:unnamed protein product, partial [Meganyctiphanes norvegica]